MSHQILYVLSHTPYGSSAAHETLELVMAAAVFEQDVSLLFLGDGLLMLGGDHQPNLTNQKSITALLSSLHLYDIEKFHVLESDLQYHGLELDDLLLPCQRHDRKQSAELLSSFDRVITL
jgi:tRNA 2-thiouridine synthesizing protein C